MATIVENIQTLQSIKSDIKNAIIEKGGSVTDAFGGYAQAIKDLPSGGGSTNVEDEIIMKTISGEYRNDRITTVGSSIFTNCFNLTGIDFPNCSYINRGAFYECSNLSTISLPNCSVIGNWAFGYCSNLSTISLPNCSYINSCAFGYCSNLSTISLPNCSVIGMSVFFKCFEITSIILSDETYVSDGAFVHASKIVNFSPNRLVIDSKTAFNSIIYDQLSNPHKMFSSLYPSYSTASIIDGDNYGINSSMISSNKSLVKVNLPECWFLGDYAFASCTNLQTVNLPMCKNISNGAFYFCYSLSYINLPNCYYINEYVFDNCKMLNSINLPKCRYISSYAFYKCSKLSIITLLSESVCYLRNSDVFFGTSINLTTGSIIVPASLVNAYKVASGWSYFKNRIFPYEG